MEGTYEVISGGQVIGSVVITRQGLYYNVSCRCRISGVVMFRLLALWDDTQIDLGILTPMDGCFGVNTQLYAKKAGKGKPVFQLKAKREPIADGLVKVCPEEPFGYLSRLEKAYLVKQNGKMLVGFREEK